MSLSKEDSFHNYLKIKEMNGLSIGQKSRILSEMLAYSENPWKVVGITEEALRVFASNDFRKKSRMGINRSHIVERNKTYSMLLSNDFTIDEFWKIFKENDKTILSTSSENMSGKFSKQFEIESSSNLFKSSGYSWRHTSEEISELKRLYNELINS